MASAASVYGIAVARGTGEHPAMRGCAPVRVAHQNRALTPWTATLTGNALNELQVAPRRHVRPEMQLTATLTRSYTLSRWLDSKIDGVAIPSTVRARMAGGCLDQALEHQKAIVLLVRRRHFGSALALVRLAFESYVRGVWLHQCATDGEVTKYTKDKLKKDFGPMLEDIEKTDAFKEGALSTIKKRSWRAMNSFTHSGYSQAVRRNTSDSMEPNYDEYEVLEALQFANEIALLASVQVASLADNVDLGYDFLKKAKRLQPIAV